MFTNNIGFTPNMTATFALTRSRQLNDVLRQVQTVAPTDSGVLMFSDRNGKRTDHTPD